MNKLCTGLIIGVLVMAPGLETVNCQGIEQPPLVYEYSIQGPAKIESDPVKTSGTIKSISASWESLGEVSLEVSANEGVSYTPIVNGRLINNGFMPGNSLRFRAAIARGSALKKIIIGYTDTSGVVRAYRNPDLAKFKYRRMINIAGGSSAVFNYPLKITLGGKSGIPVKCEPDFRDVRFTAADNQAPLDYYLEEYPGAENNPRDAIFWVKVPEIPKEGVEICLYYGNKEAKDESDAGEVFLFYDDFNSLGLDKGKWGERCELKGSSVLKDGYLKLKDCSVVTRDFKIEKGILEFKAMAEENSAIQAIARGRALERSLFPAEQIVYSSAYSGAEHAIAIDNIARVNVGNPIQPNRDYIFKAVVNESGIDFSRYAADYVMESKVSLLDVAGPDAGYIGLKAVGTFFDGGSVYFDWVRVRPYVQVEPVVEN